VAHETTERVTISPIAGEPAPKAILVDLARLERAYYQYKPDASDPSQLVRFGTGRAHGRNRLEEGYAAEGESTVHHRQIGSEEMKGHG